MSFVEFLDDEHQTAAEWLCSQRADRRARAAALRRAGEMERDILLEKYVDDQSLREKIASLPIDDLVRRARRGCEKIGTKDSLQAFLRELSRIPYGYSETDFTAVGAVSLHTEKIFEFQDSPLLACRVGRRAEAARIIAGFENDGLRYGVATSPSLVPLRGDLAGAFDKHLRKIRRAAVVARKAGFELKVRSTEIVISESGANIHTNIIWKNENRFKKFPVEEIENILQAIYYESEVYDIYGLANYMIKMPVAECSGDLLHDPDIAIWLHKALSRRRLIEFGRSDEKPHADHNLEQNVPSRSDSNGSGSTGGLIASAKKNNRRATGGLIDRGEKNAKKPDYEQTENEIIKVRAAAPFKSGYLLILVRR